MTTSDARKREAERAEQVLNVQKSALGAPNGPEAGSGASGAESARLERDEARANRDRLAHENAALRRQVAELQESNVALLQRVADLTAERPTPPTIVALDGPAPQADEGCVPCQVCGGSQTRGWHLHDRSTRPTADAEEARTDD